MKSDLLECMCDPRKIRKSSGSTHIMGLNVNFFPQATFKKIASTKLVNPNTQF